MAKVTKNEDGTEIEKKPGVIATLKGLLQNGGGTVEELGKQLAEALPERKPEAMITTIRVQLVRLAKTGVMNISKEKVEGRGTVYSGTLVEAATAE